MKANYYVYRYQGAAPLFRHTMLQSAHAEAERLAAKNPGIAYEILKVVGISQVVKPTTTTWVDGEAPSNPPQTSHGF